MGISHQCCQSFCGEITDLFIAVKKVGRRMVKYPGGSNGYDRSAAEYIRMQSGTINKKCQIIIFPHFAEFETDLFSIGKFALIENEFANIQSKFRSHIHKTGDTAAETRLQMLFITVIQGCQSDFFVTEFSSSGCRNAPSSEVIPAHNVRRN